jgi:hydrogenase maturation protease
VSQVRTLILGVGNPVRCDDGIGIHVVQRLSTSVLPSNVTTAEAGTSGLGILDVIAGYRRLIVIDAIDAGEAPGSIFELEVEDLVDVVTLHAANPHDIDLLTAIDTGRRLGLEIPTEIRIVAVQIEDAQKFSERCTSQVEAAIERACEAAIALATR